MKSPRSTIPVARPSFGPEEEEEIVAALRSGWVAQGPRVQAFEARFAERTGARHAVATSSCTTALFLSLHALGVGPGDEVIVPSLSFIASTNAVAHCGASPVFVDVDARTYNIDPTSVAEAIGPRTKAILAVHQVGLPADLDALDALARDAGVALVEDAACAIGSRHRGRPIGGDDRVACFSFHPRKVVCTGEGGMITTHDEALATRLRALRHQGMSVSDLERHRSESLVIESYPEVGYNFRMSDLHAAVGLAQLSKLDALLERRRAAAARYAVLFEGEPRLLLPHAPDYAEPNHQSYLVRLAGADAARRNRVIELAQAGGVATRRGLMAAHREAPYLAARRGSSLARTEAASDQTLVIPMDAELSAADQERVASRLCKAVSAVLGA